jgi:cytochrome c oxidase subunit 1
MTKFWDFIKNLKLIYYHKNVAMYYLVFSILSVFVTVPLYLKLVIPEIIVSDNQLSNGNYMLYNKLISDKYLAVIAYTIYPVIFGFFCNFLFLKTIKLETFKWPIINFFSFALLLISFICYILSITIERNSFMIIIEEAIINKLIGQKNILICFLVLSINLWLLSFFLMAVNIVVTITDIKTPNLLNENISIYARCIIFKSFIIIVITPILIINITLLLINNIVVVFFYKVVNTFFVFKLYNFLLIIPSIGIIGYSFEEEIKKKVFIKKKIIEIVSLLIFLDIITYIFLPILFTDEVRVIFLSNFFFMGIYIFIKILVLIKCNKNKLDPSMLFSITSIFFFMLGAFFYSIVYTKAKLNAYLNLVFFLVTDLQMLILVGTICAIFSGMYCIFIKITNTEFSNTCGKIHFWFFFVSVTFMFFPLYYLTVFNIFIKDYFFTDILEICIMVATTGYFVQFLSLIIFIFLVVWTVLKKN